MITIEPLNILHSKRLAEIISTDRILHKELSSSKPLKQTNADEYYSVCKAWEVEKNGVCYCVLLDDVPIGSISISHRDFANKTASCGYWIESSCWGKGYTTKAFELIIEEARQTGFETLSSNINKHNKASIALWRRQGASLQKKGARVFPTLVLGQTVLQHYESLIDENNDPARDTILIEYMNKWDGQEFIDALQLTAEKTVLEICVGTGRLALKVCGKCKSFTGIDFSPKTIERAKINLQAFSNMNLICADFMNYEFESKFDVIYSTLTFMHIRDKQAAINKIASLLTANGRFVLSIDKKNQDRIFDYGTRKIIIFPDNAKDTANFIRQAGLKIEKQFETEFAVVFVAVKESGQQLL